jgi:hypothetical protein
MSTVFPTASWKMVAYVPLWLVMRSVWRTVKWMPVGSAAVTREAMNIIPPSRANNRIAARTTFVFILFVLVIASPYLF